MGKAQRAKGKRGEREAIKLLEDYGYIVNDLSCGKKSGDLIASQDREYYVVEVKNQKIINLPEFLKQARENAAAKKMKWLLMCKLNGGYGWLVLKQGDKEAEIWKI